MPLFVVLGHITDTGAKDMNNFMSVLDQNLARAESLGMKIHGWYMTQGQYDFVIVEEAPSAEAIMKQSFGAAGTGLSRSETMRAYSLDEVRQILS